MLSASDSFGLLQVNKVALRGVCGPLWTNALGRLIDLLLLALRRPETGIHAHVYLGPSTPFKLNDGNTICECL
jgi:hypothetical protein